MKEVIIIGGGLAGSEAAYQLAKRGHKVKIYEMRDKKMTPAHKTSDFAELVCSNSFRGNDLTNAVGVLKKEMEMLDSLIMKYAYKNEIPAGGALAVDREQFSRDITNAISNNPNIEIIREELIRIPEDQIVIIATGPLTSPELSEQIANLVGEKSLYFYDAAAPIIEANSIDFDKAYIKSRWDKGEAAYINCPMNVEQYNKFYDELVLAETVPLKEFEEMKIFEGCMPFEIMAKRGKQTLLFGPMKPVGLEQEGVEQPHAVVQLRQDNAAKSLYNIVGFQTHLKWSEQKRIIQMIPGLENANILRYGVMHRNTFINSPGKINHFNQLISNPNIFFAGQITGVEGYVESSSSGLIAGINVAKKIAKEDMVVFPSTTAHGALLKYISNDKITDFQPMNINFGLIDSLKERIRKKKDKNEKIASIAIEAMNETIRNNKLGD